jgi:hypothetical protein
LGKTLVLIQTTFLNNVRKVGRLVLSRTSCWKWNLNNVLISDSSSPFPSQERVNVVISVFTDYIFRTNAWTFITFEMDVIA